MGNSNPVTERKFMSLQVRRIFELKKGNFLGGSEPAGKHCIYARLLSLYYMQLYLKLVFTFAQQHPQTHPPKRREPQQV